MEDMLKDFLLGEHLLLVGNQGVGKNKIIDRFLFLLNRPREYLQLHRFLKQLIYISYLTNLYIFEFQLFINLFILLLIYLFRLSGSAKDIIHTQLIEGTLALVWKFNLQ